MPAKLDPPSNPSTDLERTAYPTLSTDLMQALEAIGERRQIDAGGVIFEVGQPDYDLVVVLEGTVNVLERHGDQVVSSLPAPNFVGELSLLLGQSVFMACEAAEPSLILTIPHDRLKKALRTNTALADVLLPAFSARRQILIENGSGGLTLIGERDSARTNQVRSFLERNRVPFTYVDRSEPDRVADAKGDCVVGESGLAAIIGHSDVLLEPTVIELADQLGISARADTSRRFDMVVIGGGPAGLASAVYGASEGLKTLVVEDTAIGGQAGTSSRIENYLGFSTGVSGAELTHQGELQAVKFGAQFAAPRRAVSLSRMDGADGDGDFLVGLNDDTNVRARSIILANGVQYRRLALENLERFEGAGVYYAATDFEASLCRGANAVIVGGGNSAGQAAMHLAQTAVHVHLVIRGNGLAASMSSYLSNRIHTSERITIHKRSEVIELSGKGSLEGVSIKDVETGKIHALKAKALFPMIGAVPFTDWLDDAVELDERGYVKTGYHGFPYATSASGVFAVGDIRSNSVKRVASAVGEGSVVVSSVHEFLAGKQPTE